jgi:amino-acid N-acetyltransferase
MIRKAHVKDAQEIRALIEPYGRSGVMLPVSLSEVYDRLRSFFVYLDDADGAGEIAGTASLNVTWEDLAEIRSFAVREGNKKSGIGKMLVEACLEDAGGLGIKRVFVLTYIPDYFEKFGFTTVDKSALPHKVWSHCINCVNFPDCGEVAMIKIL